MFCTQCGHVLDENTQFCPECGKKQFDLPTDLKPQEHKIPVKWIAFVTAFCAILGLNMMGGGIIAFLFLPFIFFGGRAGGLMHDAMNGVCLGIILGAIVSIFLVATGIIVPGQLWPIPKE